jgi:hypothetical protein
LAWSLDVAWALPAVHVAVAPLLVSLAVAVAVHPEAIASALALEPVAFAEPPESASASELLPSDAFTTAELELSAVAFAPEWLFAVAVAVLLWSARVVASLSLEAEEVAVALLCAVAKDSNFLTVLAFAVPPVSALASQVLPSPPVAITSPAEFDTHDVPLPAFALVPTDANAKIVAMAATRTPRWFIVGSPRLRFVTDTQ